MGTRCYLLRGAGPGTAPGRVPRMLLGALTALLMGLLLAPAAAVTRQTSLPAGGAIEGSPALGDIDDDGALEIVAGCSDGRVYFWESGGDLIRAIDVSQGSTDKVRGSAVLGDLDGDGAPEVVVASENGKVYAFDGNGMALFTPKSVTVGGRAYPAPSPALADLDRDGRLEIVVASTAGYLYAWHGNDGSSVAGWSGVRVSTDPTATIYSSPAVADLDGDGDLEVVVGATVAAGSHRMCAWHHDGTPVAGFWNSASSAWVVSAAGVIVTTPALVDLDQDPDDPGLEVVAACLGTAGTVYAWSRDGSPLSGWPRGVAAPVHGSPAVGDVDGDGEPEVVVGTQGGIVRAWDADGTTAWSVTIPGQIQSSPALGDVDGDGHLEAVVASLAPSGGSGSIYAWHWDSGSSSLVLVGSYTLPLAGDSFGRSSPTLADLGYLDPDGLPNNHLQAIAGVTPFAGSYRAEVLDWGAPTSDALPWPMFHRDMRHTGAYGGFTDFSGTPTTGGAPLSVTFTDFSSLSGRTRLWSFGDGATSTEAHPVHSYGAMGDYTVALTISYPGGSDTSTKAGYIHVTLPALPVAGLHGTPTEGTAPLTVYFTDDSTGVIDSWSWAFGDGGTSTSQSPSHIYAADGTYTVSLTVTNAAGSDTATKTGYIVVAPPPPAADFSASPTAGQAPLTVAFTDATVGGPTGWSWTFGDGGTSTLQHPSHTYATRGTYSVTLSVVAPGGVDTETKPNYVTVTWPAPVAAFHGTPTSGTAPLTVNFTDESTGVIDSWSWAFGDGSTSAARNPSNVYSAPGAYTVSLTVANADGSDSEIKTGYISVLGPTHTLSIAGTNGSVIVNGISHSLPYRDALGEGSVVTIEAAPNPGYHFTEWSGDIIGSVSPISFAMDRDKSVAAGFAINTYTLSLSGTHGSVVVNGVSHPLPYSGTFEHGAAVMLEAIPDTGYHFGGWSGALTGAANPISLTMDGAKSVTAGFVINSYTLSLTGSHGSVSVDGVVHTLPWSGSLDYGTIVTLQALPDTGYHFGTWSGALTGSANPAALTVDADRIVEAGFAIDSYALSLTGSHGSVLVNGVSHPLPYSGSFDYGSAVTLEAVADTGYHFGGWSGDLAGSTSPTTLTIDSAKSIAVGFDVNTYTLSLSGTHGSVVVNGESHALPWSGAFSHGAAVTLEAVPETGYHFSGWSGDLAGTTNPAALAMDSAKSIAAGFAIDSYTLSLTGAHGTVSVNGVSHALPWSGSFEYGATVTLEAVADTGHHFTEWSGDLTGSVSPTSLTIGGAKSISVGFAVNSHTLSLTGMNGSMVVNGTAHALPWSGSFDYGTTVTLEAAPDAHYHFTGWSGDLTGTESPASLTIDGDKAIAVAFAIDQYPLRLTGSNGTVKVDGVSHALPYSASFDYGTVVTVEAVPNVGYHFAGWSGDLGGTTNPVSLTIDGAKSIAAAFALDSYTVSLTGLHGSVVVDGVAHTLPWSGSFSYGSTVTLQAIPEAHYHFTGWSGDLSGAASPISLLVDGEKSVAAAFAIDQQTLSLSGSHGTVLVNGISHSLPWSGSFDYGTSVTMQAVADAHYHFANWSGDLTGSTNPTSLNLDGDATVLAGFVIDQYTLSLSGSNGTVRVNGITESLPYSGTFDYGTLVALEAVADPGYSFTAWSGDLSGSASPTSITIDGAKSVGVGFSANTYTLSLSGTHGTVLVDGVSHALPWSASFEYGATVTLEAVSDTGYHFVGWSGDLTGSASPTTFTMGSSKVIAAEFAVNSYTLDLTGTHGSVIVDGVAHALPWSGSFDYGTTVTLEAAPEAHYHFAGWSGDLAGSASPTPLTMDGSKAVTAVFATDQYELVLTGSNGTMMVNGLSQALPYSGAFDYGVTVQLEAVPGTGYSFAGWFGDLAGSTNPTSIMVDGGKRVAVSFTINTYLLSLTGSHGSVSVDGVRHALPWSGEFPHGASVTLLATPDTGYHFVGWLGDLSGTADSVSITMDGPKAVAAGFAIDSYTLTISGENGSVRVDGVVHALPWTGSFEYGAALTLEAIAVTGYSFGEWSGALTGSANPTSLTIDGAKSVTAGFVINTYTLSLTGANGTVKVNGISEPLPYTGSFAYGTEVTLEAAPQSGYSFTGWSGDLTGTANPAVVAMDGAKSIAVGLAIESYTLSLSGTQGSVVVDGVTHALPWSGNFSYGSIVTLQAVPDPDYTFSGWSGDLAGNANPTALTVDGAKSVTANFTAAAHSLTLTASVDPSAVPSGGTTSPNASASDSLGHSIAYSWSDGGAGGMFSDPSAPNPTYTAPANLTDGDMAITLTVMATCAGSTPLSRTQTVMLTVQPVAHVLSVEAGTPVPGTVAAGGTTSLSATASDTRGHSASYLWSDGGAGGAFSPSATVANPTYTAPASLTGATMVITLTVTATCAGPSPVSASDTTTLTVQSAMYTLSLTRSGRGAVMVNGVLWRSLPRSATFAPGTVVTVEAVPDTGWRFTGWSGDQTGPSNPVSIVMDGNKAITANFAAGQTWFEDDDPALVYSGTWDPFMHPVASDGHARIATQVGATVAFTFTGTSVTWHTLKGPMMGVAQVYFDGRLMRTEDMFQTKAVKVAFSKGNVARGVHTVTIRVTGQKNSRSSGVTIANDAFEIVP